MYGDGKIGASYILCKCNNKTRICSQPFIRLHAHIVKNVSLNLSLLSDELMFRYMAVHNIGFLLGKQTMNLIITNYKLSDNIKG